MKVDSLPVGSLCPQCRQRPADPNVRLSGEPLCLDCYAPPRDRYLILCTDSTGSDYAVWWGPNRAGYTEDIDKAGRYTREEYEAAVPLGKRPTNILVAVAAAEAAVRRVVPFHSLEVAHRA